MNLANCVFNQLIFQFQIVCTPSGPDIKYLLLSVLSKMGWFPIRIFGQNKQKWIVGWFPIRIFDKFTFSPIYELSVQMAYPMLILEEDKAIEVSGEIIRTKLGCWTKNYSNVKLSMSYKWTIRSYETGNHNPFEQIKSQILACCVEQQSHGDFFEVRPFVAQKRHTEYKITKTNNEQRRYAIILIVEHRPPTRKTGARNL